MATTTRPPAEEIVRRGKAIYDATLREKVEAGNFGKYLIIDTVSGEYELDEDHEAASDRAAAKHPNGLLYAMRIGFVALGHIGGQHLETRKCIRVARRCLWWQRTA